MVWLVTAVIGNRARCDLDGNCNGKSDVMNGKLGTCKRALGTWMIRGERETLRPSTEDGRE